MDIHERNIVALGHDIERGLEQPVIEPPPFRTVEPRLRPGTRSIAALDGSDQQIFATAADPDLGVAAWATLYVELDPSRPDEECYREGPGSAGAWSQDELLSYHLTVELPNQDVTREFRNDLYAARQILSSTRVTEPPLFSSRASAQGVRREAARERATGEWLALRAAVTMQLPPDGLLLKDGRFNCQIEQEAAWVDQMGRIAARNGVQVIALVKAGSLYRAAYPIVRAIAHQTSRPFYFVASPQLIERAYANDTYPVRKTLMLGGRDHTDLGGIGALWTVFCPDPRDIATFVIVEFNLYDLYHYRALAREPMDVRTWHLDELDGAVHRTPQGIPHVWVTDLKIHTEHDLERLVEPTLADLLWLCEREVGHFGYPNLLGLAHRDVVLTRQKAALLRQRYLEILSSSDAILRELTFNDFLESPHKLHNIV